jgi:hypothetical protein
VFALALLLSASVDDPATTEDDDAAAARCDGETGDGAAVWGGSREEREGPRARPSARADVPPSADAEERARGADPRSRGAWRRRCRLSGTSALGVGHGSGRVALETWRVETD